MLKPFFIAAAVLFAGVNTVSAEDLHCQFGSLSIDRTDQEMRACDAGGCYVVIDGKLNDGTRIQIGSDHKLRLDKYVVTCADRTRIRSVNDPALCRALHQYSTSAGQPCTSTLTWLKTTARGGYPRKYQKTTARKVQMVACQRTSMAKCRTVGNR
jgi:hypothetical protein